MLYINILKTSNKAQIIVTTIQDYYRSSQILVSM